MPERTVTIASSVGLHARPAAIFVKAASEQPVKVTIVKVGSGADPVDASSILGEGADATLDALAELLATDLDAQ